MFNLFDFLSGIINMFKNLNCRKVEVTQDMLENMDIPDLFMLMENYECTFNSVWNTLAYRKRDSIKINYPIAKTRAGDNLAILLKNHFKGSDIEKQMVQYILLIINMQMSLEIFLRRSMQWILN
jgi:hypothetical protein